MKSRVLPHICTHPLSADLGDRQSSLLPGQVRTPQFPLHSPLTDWAATSSLWEEDNGRNNNRNNNNDIGEREDSQYPPSVTTPLGVYAKSEVWCTGGSAAAPLAVPSFTDAHEKPRTTIIVTEAKSPLPQQLQHHQQLEAAAVAATTTLATSMMVGDVGTDVSSATRGGPPVSAGPHVEATEDEAVVPVAGELPVPTRTNVSTPSPTPSGTYTASRSKYHYNSSHPTSNLEEVATSIIAAAGLPMSVASLAEYITEGQPQLPPTHATTASGGAVSQSYTHIHPPPQGCSWDPPRRIDSNVQPLVNGELKLAAWSNNATFNAAQPTPFVSVAPATRTAPQAVAHKSKTQSEFLSDLLYFHANFFPPPPPPRVPMGTRRSRAELWYHYASKWDITHRLPPPPRTPLPEMELQRQERLQELTRTPYHGDRWLKICERWYDVVEQQFNYPADNTAVSIQPSFVLRHIIAG